MAEVSSFDSFVNSEKLQLHRSDLIIGEHMINIIKLVEKGYINPDLLNKVTIETIKSKHFTPFVPWLRSIQDILRHSKTDDLIDYCRQYATRKATQPTERVLERSAGNFCRERTIEAIGRDIDKTHNITDHSILFIQENLKFFLTKKNKKNFAFFIQSQASKPEILKRISQEVTSYSVQHGIVPSQEVLKDILINEQITKLIQDKGFNPLQHQNVFHAEYGKLIELGYKSLDTKNDAKPNLAKAKEHYQFMKNYLELNQDHLPVGLCLTRLNDFSKAVFRAGFHDLSRDIFKFIVKKNHKEIQEDALYFYLWTFMSQSDYAGALKLADSYNLIKKSSEILDARLKFWIAYSQEQVKKEADAIKLYEQIVTNNPLSYYAIMATKKLQALKPDSAAVKFYSESAIKPVGALSVEPRDLSDDYTSSLVRLKAWAKIDSLRFINLELKRINRHSMPDFFVKYTTEQQPKIKSDLHLVNSKLIQDAQNYLATFRYLYSVLDKKEVIFNRSLLEILYPRPYLAELSRELKTAELDPIVVLSLIRQESVFNPLARSPVGARGLMQIMPATARRIRKATRDHHLVDPNTNIEIGTKYFKGLVKRYDGNLVFVLSAYNAGESRVERWKGLYFDQEDTILKNIEAIPFLETRNYVKLIFRNIFFYKLLTENNKLADSRDLNKIFDVSLGFKR